MEILIDGITLLVFIGRVIDGLLPAVFELNSGELENRADKKILAFAVGGGANMDGKSMSAGACAACSRCSPKAVDSTAGVVG